MHLIKVDPRALKENPDRLRQTKSTPQADALLLATIKAVGIVQPPVITPETGGGNGYVINAGHRRVKQAIAAGLEEIDVLVDEAGNDNGAMRSMVTNIAFEPMNPVDQWRAIERLVALGWTEEAIGVALNPMSAALGVLVIAVATEFSVILSARYEEEREGGASTGEALRLTYARTGTAVLASGITSIAGFGVLSLSGITMLRDFGLATVVDLSASVAGVMLVLPAVLVWAENGFSPLTIPKRRPQGEADPEPAG